MIAAIIGAKGDSNRIPKKNMKEFCGRPLVGWSIEQALCSKLVDLTVVSTDCPEIKEYALSLGAKVIDRPKALTYTPVNQAAAHAVEELAKEGHTIEHFLTILPTSPIRLPQDMDGLVSVQLTNNAPSSAGVCRQLETILYTKEGRKATIIVYDKKNTYYVDGGGMSCSRPEWYIEYSSRRPITDDEFDRQIIEQINRTADYGYYLDFPVYVMEEWQTPELDLPEHWGMAEAVMQEYILKPLGENCYKRYKERK